MIKRKSKLTVFKPHKEVAIQIPETFEGLIIAKGNDTSVQQEPGIWFTRNFPNVKYNSNKEVLQIGERSLISIYPLYKGSIEVTVPKDYFKNKSFIEIIFQGRGWLSVKLLESTRTKEGVQTQFGGSWKKLDTVREKEIFSFDNSLTIKKLNIKKFKNKPFNVHKMAYLKGWRRIKKEKIVSLEITVRLGYFEIQSLRII